MDIQPMNPQNHKRKQRGSEQSLFDFGHIEFLISNMPPDDKRKIEFVEGFIHRYLIPNIKDDDILELEPMDYRLLKYLMFSLLMKYESETTAS